MPTPLVICAIFGRGDVQAFAIGALVPWVDVAPDGCRVRVSLFIVALALVLCGHVRRDRGCDLRRWIAGIDGRVENCLFYRRFGRFECR